MPAGRSGIRPGVNAHLLLATALGDSDRAALQSLIPLASGLGAGTIFGLFFVGRRRAGFAVFEAITIVAVLVAVSTTAYYCIALLHRDTAVSNKELVETALPLVVALVLLIVMSIVARLRGATQRIVVVLPLVLVAVVATIELASSGVALEPTAAPVVALVILAAGAAFGALGTLVDARARREARRTEHDRLALLTGRGYVSAEARLALAVPRLVGDPPAGAPGALAASADAGLPLDVWRRGEAAFIDGPGAKRLRDEVDARWQSLAAGEARGAIGPFVLLEVESTGGRRGTPTELRFDTLRPGTATPRRTARLQPNGDGLFDVTDLVA
jgi:chromate transport protein ChrA